MSAPRVVTELFDPNPCQEVEHRSMLRELQPTPSRRLLKINRFINVGILSIFGQ